MGGEFVVGACVRGEGGSIWCVSGEWSLSDCVVITWWVCGARVSFG